MLRFAASYLYVSADNRLKRFVVEMDGAFVAKIYPLIEEIASTVWLDGVIILSTIQDYELAPNKSFRDVVTELALIEQDNTIVYSSIPIYAYSLRPVDLFSEKLLASSCLYNLIG